MLLLYPSLPYEPRTIDPMWEPEYLWAQQQGWAVMLYDVQTQRLWPTAIASIPALYRGWMLSETEYAALAQRVSLQVSLADYVASHQATGWYEAIQNFTFPSQFRLASATPDFSVGQRYFVKGLVKSFGADSVIDSAEQWQHLCREHELLPAEPLFVRQFVLLAAGSERRFFVVAGVAYGAEESMLPTSLLPTLELLKQRLFYSLDVAITQVGVSRVVEIGDGQVSDLKEWELPDFGHTVLRALARSTQP